MLFGIDVPGYASLMVAVLFFGGVQLISLGVLGEYVGRILVEAKQRPLYVVRDEIDVAHDRLAGNKMERAVFDRMAELDQQHWWFVARRRILTAVIRRIVRPAKDCRILEIGCGTGHNFADAPAIRPGRRRASRDPVARDLASLRLGHPIIDARLPDLAAIPRGPLRPDRAARRARACPEHDVAALRAIRRRLKPTGALLLTVPANPWMWSAHDVAHHHYRRYSKRQLARVFAEAGFKVRLHTHFNSLLFPLIAAARAVAKLSGRESSDDVLPSAPVNAALNATFGLEAALVGRVPLPVGSACWRCSRRRSEWRDSLTFELSSLGFLRAPIPSCQAQRLVAAGRGTSPAVQSISYVAGTFGLTLA